MLDGVASLLDQSLLHREADVAGEPRFGMLETLREYALERLAARAERTALQERHADYFVGLAQQAEGELRGPRQADWLDRLQADHDNIRQAWEWLASQGRAGDAGQCAAAGRGR